MSLNELSTAELQELLMVETKRFTTGMRDGTSSDNLQKTRLQINEIVSIIEQRKNDKSRLERPMNFKIVELPHDVYNRALKKAGNNDVSESQSQD
jgi:hypothetical protein